MVRKNGIRTSSFLKICCLCVILSCVFILVSCDLNGNVEHDCIYSNSQLNEDNKSSFVSRVEKSSGHQIYTYYLSKSVTLAETLSVPEGTFVGICLGEFNITVGNGDPLYKVVDANGDGVTEDGGVFLFNCGVHAYHSKKQFQYMDQAAIDFFGRSGYSIYSRFSASELGISLRTDLHISAAYTSFIIPEGKTLNVCTNGHKFTYDLNLEANGGKLAVFDCQSASYHECLHLIDDAPAVDQSMLETLYANVMNAQPGAEIHAYLKGDISWAQEMVIPEGVSVMVCLNGHTATGPIREGTYTATVINELTGEEETVEKECGDIIFFDCSYHLCTGICMTGEMLALNNNSIDWTVRLLEKYVADVDSVPTVYCVLEDDVDVPLIEGVNLVVCVNGFKNRDNKWLTKTVDGENVTVGGVVYYNCASSHVCEIASMIGLENKSILLDTADGVNMFLSQLGQEVDGYVLPAACFSLTSDLKGTGELRAPEGTYAVLCLNGFSLGDVTVPEGGNVFVYECGSEYCSEMKNDVLAFDQGIIDMFSIYAMSTGSPYPLNANYIFAISEDVVVPEGAFAVGAGYTVNFCTRGHSISGVENVSGVITHKGCTHRIPDHLCAVADMLGRESTPIKTKSVATVNAMLAEAGSGVHLYHLTENLSGSGVLTAPANTVVGICLDGFSVGDVKVADGSNIFFYECGKYYCSLVNSNIPTFDQGVFDFLNFCTMGEPFYLDYSAAFALSEDVTIPIGLFVNGDNTLYVCTCGNNFNLASSSGNIVVHNDDKLDAYNHFCTVPYVLDSSLRSTPLYASDVASLNAAFRNDADNGIGFYHLTSDIVGGGTLELPEDFYAAICLNGFSMDNVVIPSGVPVFVYECGTQYCNEEQTYIASFDQGVFDFLYALLYAESEGAEELAFYLSSNAVFAISEDVCIPFSIIVSEGSSLKICTCGHTLTTLEGVELTNVVTHNNCLPAEEAVENTDDVSVDGCSVCNRMSAKPLNFTSLREMIDHKGNIILAPGSYYYYLENDFQLTRTIVIPDGVDIHICLHGHTLYSAYLWSDSTTFGGGFPESTCMSLANVMSGATFNIYDCSDKMTGNIALKQFRMRDKDTGRMEMVTHVVNEEQDSNTEGLAALLSSLGSCIAVNYGTVNVYGGNMYAVAGFLNTDGGVINIYNGNIYAMFSGILNVSLSDLSAARNTKIYIGEGATISSIYIGVYAMGGDVTLDGGTINAGISGIAAVSENASIPASVTINGGEINVGSSDRLMASSMSAWSAMGGEVIDFAGASIDLGADEYAGVTVSHSLTLNGDVNMIMGEMATANKSNGEPREAVEFVLMGTPDVSVSNKVKDKYTLSIEDRINVGDNDAFIPVMNAAKFEATDGSGIVIVPISGNFVSYAAVTDMSVSTEGDIKVNIYTEVDPAFVASGRVRFYVEYANGTHVYTLDDAELVVVDGVTKYKFAIHTAAKDYASSVNCYFALAPYVPTEDAPEDPYADYVGVCIGSQKLSIQSYLNTLINGRGYDEDTVNIAKAMKNYCAAAAYHFGVSENYAVVEGLAPYLEEVTVDVLDPFKPTKGEAFDSAPIVFKTATVVLKSETSIRIYFDLVEGFSISSDADGNVWLNGTYDGKPVEIPLYVTVMGDDTPVAITLIETGIPTRPYCIEITGVFATNYFTMYSVKIADQVYMNYSVASYARTVVANKNNAYSEDVVDVVKAMMVYGAATVSFYEGNGGTG